MEPVEVVVHLDIDGTIEPLRFTWKGQTYQLESVGRIWDDAQGRHFLAMTPIEQVVELIYVSSNSQWFLRRFGSRPSVI